MRKTLTAITAAGALAVATVSVPTQANALAEWVIPAIIVAGIGGAAVGTTVAANSPRGSVYVQPRAEASCQIVRERTANGWRRVEVCQ
jgi:hypothetical protein